MKSHKVKGGGGVLIHAVEAGNPDGRPIVFIHGFSQCWRCWGRQVSSELADDYRLVAVDLRGHGLSDKPREGYDDSKLWAEDLHAVIRSLHLDRPLLSGWSYGPLVILDYLRHHGEGEIGGIHFVGAVTKLGSDAAMVVIAPGFLELMPGFFSTDAKESAQSLESLLRLCFPRGLSAADLGRMLEDSVAVPSYVRQALFSRVLDNDDLLATIRKPVLITHGGADAVVKPAAVDQHKARLAHAEVHVMPGVGHAAFWEDAPAFNRRLRAFCSAL